MPMEVAKEEIHGMERSISANLRHVAYAGPPKRPAPIVGHARPSDVLCFTSD